MYKQVKCTSIYNGIGYLLKKRSGLRWKASACPPILSLSDVPICEIPSLFDNSVLNVVLFFSLPACHFGSYYKQTVLMDHYGHTQGPDWWRRSESFAQSRTQPGTSHTNTDISSIYSRHMKFGHRSPSSCKTHRKEQLTSKTTTTERTIKNWYTYKEANLISPCSV